MHRYHHDEESFGRGRAGHPHGGFGPHGFKGPFAGAGHGPGAFASMIAQRMRRGDVRAAVLRLLSEQPMHGYQVIQELSSRSGGAWNPSPGSVYPTLQLLADEGLVVAEETGGKKVFSLTETGRAAVAETAETPAPWEEVAQSDTGAQGYREAAGRLMPAVMQVGKTGSEDQITRAITVLTETRKRLYAILSED